MSDSLLFCFPFSLKLIAKDNFINQILMQHVLYNI